MPRDWRGEGAPPAGVGLRGKGAASGALSGAPPAACVGEGTASGAFLGISRAACSVRRRENHLKYQP